MVREKSIKNITDKPLANKGLISYRLKNQWGSVMIGALDDDDAFSQAMRSDKQAIRKNLQKWNGAEYVPCSIQSLTLFHGSGTAIDLFDYKFTNAGSDQLGSGFYFTNQMDTARQYAFRRRLPDEKKLGGEDSPNVIHAHLAITNPMEADQVGPSLTATHVAAMIGYSACLETALENFGDVGYEGLAEVRKRAIAAYVTRPSTSRPLVRQLFDVANDFFPDNAAGFNKAVFEVLGYDGVIKTFDDGQVHYVAFFPEQIQIVAVEQLAHEDALCDADGSSDVENLPTEPVA